MKTLLVIFVLVLVVNLANAGYIPQQYQEDETRLVTRRSAVEKSGLARSDFDLQLKTSIVIFKNNFFKKHILNNWILSGKPFTRDH